MEDAVIPAVPTGQFPSSVLVLLITAECVWYNNLFLYTVIAGILFAVEEERRKGFVIVTS